MSVRLLSRREARRFVRPWDRLRELEAAGDWDKIERLRARGRLPQAHQVLTHDSTRPT